MAKEEFEQQEPGQQKKGPGKFGVFLIVAMLIAIAVGLLRDEKDPSTQSGSRAFDPEQARIEEEQQRLRLEEIRSERGGASIDDGGLDPFAAMSAMTRRQEMLEQQLNDVTDKLRDAQGSQEELSKLDERYEQLEAQLRDLTQMLKDDAENARRRDREYSAELNDGSDDLAFDLEGGLSGEDIESGSGGADNAPGYRLTPLPKPRSPYGDNYIVLNSGTRNPVLSNSNPFDESAGGAQGNGEGLFGVNGDLKAPNPFKEDDDSESQPNARYANETARPSSIPPEYDGTIQPGYAGSDRQRPESISSPSSDGSNSESSDSTINVPAFSFVEAETLHGLDCPIGAALPRSAAGNSAGVTPGAAQPMPVVLPLRGKIRGPNGNVVDLGTAHVMGWCIGRRVDRGESGRAMIKVESISYWDRKGEPQYLNGISGDVISLLDNHRGIQAPIDEVRRSYLGEQAGAAALAAAATQLNQAQFEETRNPEGGVDQVFNGNQGLAVGSQAGSAAFSTIAELINQEAREAFDTVRVPSGAPVRVLFMTPFSVTNTKLEVEDEILNAYDVLI